MDEGTRDYVDKCLALASKDIERDRNNPQVIAEAERRMIEIKLQSSVALERLEMGQAEAYNQLRQVRYRCAG